MSEIDDGGPAYPISEFGLQGYNGISIRDWFAGQASEQDIEDHLGGEVNPKTGLYFNRRSREQAKYHYADAMIAARKEKK